MAHDLSGDILTQISNYAVGLVMRKDGAGSEVLGSGVLVSIDGRRGILTAGHVAEKYDRLTEIGLVRFLAGSRQRLMLSLADVHTVIIQSSDTWSADDYDLAFTLLRPEVADTVAARSVFLNVEKNRAKIEGANPNDGKHFDAMLGLIGEFSETPFAEGLEIISPMRAVLHSGRAYTLENGLLAFDPMEYNMEKLPVSFGGMSGGGVWRIHYVETESGPKIVDKALWGVASWQYPDSPKLACQSWDRIDQGLIPAVRQNLQWGN
jgi:hypothetical protein